MIFQDPFASLDPRKTIAQIIGEPLKIHNIGTEEEKRAKVIELIKKVGLKPMHLDRYPHEFSGGQRQRISIARCLALQPELIIADEPVSALDVSVQAQVINLMRKLQKEFDLTYIFISHDLSVVEYFCDEVAVMYLGKVVEKAPTKELFANPQHPYTQALLASIPKVGQGKVRKRKILTGDVPSPLNPPSGCTFHPRCEFATDQCKKVIPEFVHLTKTHKTSCHLLNEEKN
jgi:oligopeptide/dipeptide ABC transporter ATP-binding protein